MGFHAGARHLICLAKARGESAEKAGFAVVIPFPRIAEFAAFKSVEILHSLRHTHSLSLLSRC